MASGIINKVRHISFLKLFLSIITTVTRDTWQAEGLHFARGFHSCDRDILRCELRC